MRARKRPAKPTEAQAKWLQRIAHSPLMKTYLVGDPDPHWSLQNGATIPSPIAQVLVRNGWVKGRRDGLFGDEQSYVRVYEALRPNV